MKKFQFAAGLAALAMLASCSSDAPQSPIDGPEDGEKGMFLSISLTGESTRDTETVTEIDGESDIKKLEIFVLRQNGELYFRKTVPAADIENGTATFTVSQTTFNTMKERSAAGEGHEKFQILIYANSQYDISTNATTDANALLHGKTQADETITWGIANRTGAGTNTVTIGETPVSCFIMSSAEPCLTDLTPYSDAFDGTSKVKAWNIKGNIKLSRLATRFDYSTDNKASYTPTYHNGVTLEIAGMGVNTLATTTYRVAQFSENGKSTDADKVQFEPSGKMTYRVTDSYSGDDTDVPFSTYASHNYDLVKGKKTTIYARPNTIAKNTYATLADVAKADQKGFKKIPYAVVKAEIKNAASESMKKGHNVYAVNGIFIGGIEDLLAMKKAGTEFKPADITSTTADTNLTQLITNLNWFLKTQFTYDPENPDADALTTDETRLLNNLSGAEEYAPVKIEGVNHYYTYYSALIINDSSSSDPSHYYGVSRNTCYTLAVKSFQKLGNAGTGYPGDGPTVSDQTPLNMALSVSVNAWTPNFNNKWDL